MPGELLLLQRYLSAHPAPKYVDIALAPAMFGWVSDIRLVRYNLWHTFQQDDERSFLKTYLPDIDRRDWLPAIADLQERIVEPFFSLLKVQYLSFRRQVTRIASGTLDPDPDTATDVAMVDRNALSEAISDGLRTVPAPINAAALRKLCLLSEQHGFRVKLAWPPLVAEIEGAMTASGALAELERNVFDIMADHCHVHDIFDFNSIRTYTVANFHRDMVHLFGEGWEQRYASDLRGYLSGLPD